MARTPAQVIASARGTTNDDDGVRVKDPEALGYVVDALNSLKNARPDLFLGNWGEIEAIGLTDALPVPAQWFRPIVDYVIGRMELKDDEHAISGRAELALKLAGGAL